ncbi:unnamed protein product [Gemmata massiliana]|uniref:Uncharacterized protein n=1 Tax=Gemmata massiliana TaxID=1210884 RepID=A0A6P2D1W1_9BACT|nr:hypothetical protein [Gemmata massiliana]VTR93380.1 unnamed protein product [Gemmata massiliana]
MSEPSSYGPNARREQQPVKEMDDTELADVVLRPYGEGSTFYVNWEVRPKDPGHAILRTQVVVEPKGIVPIDYNIIAQCVSTDGGVRVPPGVMLRGESTHRNIPPNTSVKITVFGEVQFSDGANGWYSYCRVVVSGSDVLTPCEA